MSHDNNIGDADAFLVIDVQKGFCPGGALPIPGGDAILTRINALIDEATRAGALVVAASDWRPANHMSFTDQGGPWPRHCVRNETAPRSVAI
ncbi:isochorismatase family protein [Rhodoblastus sp.]|uniref:isochorismatase family protein n=1 Tax=Rhodoblastus sp. TaxID=1962975 RepID=UPI003F99610D